MILNVVVYFDNREEVINYALELDRQLCRNEIFLVIVLNKYKECDRQLLIEQLQNLGIQSAVYNPQQNLGYLNGLLFGYKTFCKLEKEVVDYIVFSNTDIRIPDNTFFSHLINANYDNSIWLVGPSILNSQLCIYSNPYYWHRYSRKELSYRLLLTKNVSVFKLFCILHGKRASKKTEKKSSCYIYGIHGSFMILRKELINVLCERKPWCLLYGEEVLLAEVVKKNGKKVYYDSEIEIVHDVSSVTSTLSLKKNLNYQQEGLRRILDEFY